MQGGGGGGADGLNSSGRFDLTYIPKESIKLNLIFSEAGNAAEFPNSLQEVPWRGLCNLV